MEDSRVGTCYARDGVNDGETLSDCLFASLRVEKICGDTWPVQSI